MGSEMCIRDRYKLESPRYESDEYRIIRIERVQFSIVPGARLFSLGKRILTRHPCESSLVFYRRKSPKINKRVHFLTKSAKKCPPPSPPYILCGPGPGRAPPGLPPGGAPVCGFGGLPSTGYNQTRLDRRLYCTNDDLARFGYCLLYTSPSPRDLSTSRMPSSA